MTDALAAVAPSQNLLVDASTLASTASDAGAGEFGLTLATLLPGKLGQLFDGDDDEPVLPDAASLAAGVDPGAVPLLPVVPAGGAPDSDVAKPESGADSVLSMAASARRDPSSILTGVGPTASDAGAPTAGELRPATLATRDAALALETGSGSALPEQRPHALLDRDGALLVTDRVAAPPMPVRVEDHGVATPASRPAQLAIDLPLGHRMWADAFAARVVWQAGEQMQSARIQLNPPELGPIDVQVNLADDKASVAFAAHHVGAREAIQDAMPRLRDMLADAGLTLTNSSVSQQAPNQRQAPDSGQSSGPAHSAPELLPVLDTPSRPVLGLVDCFV